MAIPSLSKGFLAWALVGLLVLAPDGAAWARGHGGGHGGGGGGHGHAGGGHRGGHRGAGKGRSHGNHSGSGRKGSGGKNKGTANKGKGKGGKGRGTAGGKSSGKGKGTARNNNGKRGNNSLARGNGKNGRNGDRGGRSLAGHRPRGLEGRGNGRGPLGDRRGPGSGLARNRRGTRNVVDRWSRGSNRTLRGLAGRGGRLTGAERAFVNRRIGRLGGLGRRSAWQNAEFQAFLDFRNQDLFFGRLGPFYAGFGGWYGGLGLGGTLLPPLDEVDGPADYLCPGIEPYYPAFEFPADVNGEAPEYWVCQIQPGSQEYDLANDLPADGDASTAVVRRTARQLVIPPLGEDGPDATDTADVAVDGIAIEDQEILTQRTRYLQLGNGTAKKVTFHIRYHSRDEDDAFQWHPTSAGDSIQVTVAAGAVADIYDGDWHVHADRVSVWAETEDGQQWNAFKQKTLWLVPEADAEGNHTYQAPAIDTFAFTVTPKALEVDSTALAK